MISEQIRDRGPLRFSEFQELALYHPQAGFYSNRGSAGRSGDFITSPEVGPLFAHVMAMALDRWWRQLRRPNPFYVIEVGAGIGTLAAGILEAEPQCADALRYVAVERSAALRGEQAGRLPIQPPETVLDMSADGARRLIGSAMGPLVTTMSEMPSGKFTGIVLANELLDNMPVDLYERRGRHWYRLCVGVTKEGALTEVLDPLDDSENADELAMLHDMAPGAGDGARLPVQKAACDWLQQALGTLDRGRVVVIDYMHTTKWMSRHPIEEWLRTYRGHRPGGDPLELPGTQDITCEVAVDQLAAVARPDVDHMQAEFLDAHGLADLVSEAREAWHTRAAMGDLGAMRARARVQEGRALTDVNGLGRFRVLEWEVPPRTAEEREKTDR